ncbi:MAG TPA: SgcJ/EcaC family oxidoreductase [Thermomicrobiales bacterium]|nr:SgcJ/EcaC family oxidoreductase [Thermomicrobiales bacterium]
MTKSDETAVSDLYRHQLNGWNARNAGALGTLYAEDANVVGFDGSQVDGRAEIEAHFRQIFADHQTATYVGKIREVRFLTPDVAVLRAVAGLVPPGKSDLNPDANAVQTLVAVRQDGNWRIAVYQNTPAAFHERPEASQALTDELRQLL